ncbi:hypothetical protein FB45DRAFT_926904 [Roridomyces roridus]|uniref:Uncharacterized protein n=1 Tax=Roridomyces roridus TaxID=1738132 RepID=A0AAD7BIL5_9AGAR|nr:hypothetical protein FB45DRAFT_926904 [Roridomyces roridus]
MYVSARAPQALEGVLTNAQRLARGFPLLKPRRRSNFPRQSTPSAVAPLQVTCNIHVSPTNSGSQGPTGWFMQSMGGNGIFYGVQMSQSDGNALVVSFSYTPGSTSHFPMLASTTLYSQYPYMAAIISADSDSNDLSSASTNYAFFGKSGDVPEGRPSPNTANSYSDATSTYGVGVETALWSYDPATRVLTPSWINDNGQRVPAYLMYDTWDGKFFVAGQSSVESSPVFLNGGLPMTFTCLDVVPIVPPDETR